MVGQADIPLDLARVLAAPANPKHETRNPKQIRNAKGPNRPECAKRTQFRPFLGQKRDRRSKTKPISLRKAGHWELRTSGGAALECQTNPISRDRQLASTTCPTGRPAEQRRCGMSNKANLTWLSCGRTDPQRQDCRVASLLAMTPADKAPDAPNEPNSPWPIRQTKPISQANRRRHGDTENTEKHLSIFQERGYVLPSVSSATLW